MEQARGVLLGHCLLQLIDRLTAADHDLWHRFAAFTWASQGGFRPVLSLKPRLRRGQTLVLLLVIEQNKITLGCQAVIVDRGHHLDAPVVVLQLHAFNLRQSLLLSGEPAEFGR